MELIGEEKRIQALFRELRLDDEGITPRFSGLWNRAQSTSVRPRRAFNLRFALATVLLVCALFTLAWWSRHWRQSEQSNAVVSTGPVTPSLTPLPGTASPGPKRLASAGRLHRVGSNLQNRKLVARRQAELMASRAAIREAAAISTWQSPTIALMQSPADEVLSLPQLNQPVNELKSFLPNRPN